MKYILSISLALNLLLAAVGYYYESRTHQIQIALYDRDVAIIKESSRPDNYWNYDWKRCLTKLKLNPDIVVFGDSITADSDFQELIPDYNIVNLGLCGNRIYDMMRRIPTISALSPKHIYIMAGINDAHHLSVERILERYEKMIKSMLESCPISIIHIQSILPVAPNQVKTYAPNSKIIEINKGLKKLAQNYRLDYLDIYSAYEENGYLRPEYSRDGVHLRTDGYEPWANIIKSSLQ